MNRLEKEVKRATNTWRKFNVCVAFGIYRK